MTNYKIMRAESDLVEKETNIPSWLTEFAKAQRPQTIVDVTRDRHAKSRGIVEYLNQYLNGKSRYASVDDAVASYRERAGLNAYIESLNSKSAQTKTAEHDDGFPESLAKYPGAAEDIKNYVKNNIRNSHGLGASVPQLQHDILSIFGIRYGISPQDVMNRETAAYLSNCIASEQTNASPEEHSPNIGEGIGRSDDAKENQDMWAGLMPVKF